MDLEEGEYIEEEEELVPRTQRQKNWNQLSGVHSNSSALKRRREEDDYETVSMELDSEPEVSKERKSAEHDAEDEVELLRRQLLYQVRKKKSRRLTVNEEQLSDQQKEAEESENAEKTPKANDLDQTRAKFCQLNEQLTEAQHSQSTIMRRKKRLQESLADCEAELTLSQIKISSIMETILGLWSEATNAGLKSTQNEIKLQKTRKQYSQIFTSQNTSMTEGLSSSIKLASLDRQSKHDNHIRNEDKQKKSKNPEYITENKQRGREALEDITGRKPQERATTEDNIGKKKERPITEAIVGKKQQERPATEKQQERATTDDIIGKKKERATTEDIIGKKKERTTTEDIIGKKQQERATTDDIIGKKQQERETTDDIIGKKKERATTEDIIGKKKERTTTEDIIGKKQQERPATEDIIGKKKERATTEDIIGKKQQERATTEDTTRKKAQEVITAVTHLINESDNFDGFLASVRAYRLSPRFSHRLLAHHSISNRLDPFVPLCPFQLHGRCADTNCPWQHENEYRMSEVDIVSEVIALWPSVCPQGMLPAQYASSLLASDPLEVVIGFLLSIMPEEAFNIKLNPVSGIPRLTSKPIPTNENIEFVYFLSSKQNNKGSPSVC